jgi:metallo-beta-lactamase class B
MVTRFLVAAALLAAAVTGPAARSPAVTNEAWTRPFPALRIVGNLYYVGTYDLSSYLITTPEETF